MCSTSLSTAAHAHATPACHVCGRTDGEEFTVADQSRTCHHLPPRFGLSLCISCDGIFQRQPEPSFTKFYADDTARIEKWANRHSLESLGIVIAIDNGDFKQPASKKFVRSKIGRVRNELDRKWAKWLKANPLESLGIKYDVAWGDAELPPRVELPVAASPVVRPARKTAAEIAVAADVHTPSAAVRATLPKSPRHRPVVATRRKIAGRGARKENTAADIRRLVLAIHV